MNYTHLTREERYQIHALRSQGIGIAAIAAQLVRHRSTIDRELARNTSGEGYDPAKAHTQAKARLSGPDNVRTLSPHTWQWAERYLRLGLSPEQVSARLHLEGRARLSKESLYLRAYADQAAGRDLAQYFRCQKVRRKRYGSGQERRGVLRNCKRIDQRPKVVDKRSRIADWEGDTVIGADKHHCVLTLVERKTGLAIVKKLASRSMAEVNAAAMVAISEHRKRFKTITFDNGTEFNRHQLIASQLGLNAYFCDPRAPWQKGGVENANGRLRRWLPRHLDIDQMSDEEIQDIVM